MKRTRLDGDWAFAEKSWQDGKKLACSTLEWLPAQVPGHVHVDLVKNGVIADPFERMNELGCQWVDEGAFSYRTSFEFQPDETRPQRLLGFSGLDGVCSVFLNGERIAEHDSMFVPLEVDVTTRLVAGENELRVDFESAARVGRDRRARYFAAEHLSENTERFDERAFVRKAQYMYGWDWGPRLVSAGIWQAVSLIEHAGRLRNVRVSQHHHPDRSVSVSTLTAHDGDGVVVHCLDGAPPKAGDGALFHWERPELWFPNGMGPQPLLALETYLCPPSFDARSLPADPARAKALLAEVAQDRLVTRIGLRRVRLVREPDPVSYTHLTLPTILRV